MKSTAENQGENFPAFIDPKDGDISGVVVGFSKAPTKFQPDWGSMVEAEDFQP